MAKFVLAGKAGCPSYARAEMLADNLVTNLPDFSVHKVVLSQEDWPSWVKEKCHENGWEHCPTSSPLIWRELIDRGGKGVYLGGVKEFQQYTKHYYGIAPTTSTDTEVSIAEENFDMFQTIQLEVAQSKSVNPTVVCITHASCTTAYHLASLLLTQKVFGLDTRIHLMLFDDSSQYDLVNGLALELQDLASSHLQEVTIASSLHEAFTAVSAVFLLNYNNVSNDSKTLETSQEAARLYTNYANILDYNANKDVCVILTGPYANMGAAVMARTASSIDSRQFIASPALAEYQASAILADKLNISSSDIKQVGIWGTCDSHVIPDTTHTVVHNYKGSIVGDKTFSLSLNKCLFDVKWLQDVFPNLLIKRYFQDTKSSLVEAVSLANLMKSWWSGGNGAWHSVGVVFDGDTTAMCQPCRCTNGKWEHAIDVDSKESELKEKLEAIRDTLRQELKNVTILSSQEKTKLEEENMQ